MTDAATPKRVAVVSPIFGGTFPVAAQAQRALAALGHDAALMDMRPFAADYMEARKRGTQDAQLAFFGAVRGHIEDALSCTNPELVVALAQAPVRHDLLAELRAAGTVSALWFIEHFERFLTWRAVAPHYDWILRFQKGPFAEALSEAGARNHAYLPLATSPEATKPAWPTDDDPYRSALCFFGSPYQNRIDLFSSLADRGLSLWGKGWAQVPGPLSTCVRAGEEYLDRNIERRVYAGADIVINLHSRLPGETVFDFINPRTFDVAGMGRFQLVDRRTLLAEHFGPEEIVTFESARDLREKVDHFLHHPEQRRTIADAARARVMAEHTYEHRMQQLLHYTLNRTEVADGQPR